MLAELPDGFLHACRWQVYAEALAGPNGLPSTDIPAGLSMAQKVEIQKRNVETLKLREILYPEDDADG